MTGTWSPTPTFAYTWTAPGLATATGSTYVVPAGAAGHNITVTVTGTRAGYTPRSVAAVSEQVTVSALPPVGSATPTITGDVVVDGTVTAVTPGWESGATFAYDWRVDGVSTGSVGSSFVVPATAASRALTVRVTGSKAGTTSVVKDSAVSTVALATLAAGTVSISGSPTVDRSVTAAPGSWTPGAVLTYDWRLGGVSTGSTGPTFNVPASAAGSTLTVAVTGTRNGYVPTTRVSPVSVVSPGTLAATRPRISGTAKVGRTLKVKVGSWSPTPRLRYQWFANGRKIGSKGTKSSFKVTSRQKGKAITVRVTGTKVGYTTVVKTSRKTKKVAGR